MDEGTLNDLLECSVCLERLDTTSRVLPCQHTFCRKCLEIIVARNNELRCPECRVLINMKIDDLPPNVLLMRILEGMKNSSAPNQSKTNAVRQQQTASNNSVHPNSTKIKQDDIIQIINEQNNKIHQQNNYKKHIPYAKALYDFVSKETGDLNFKRGDHIYLIKRLDLNWYIGELKGKKGTFPGNFVQVVVPLPFPQCKALYDFRMGPNEEEGCLTFKKGAIINVFRRVDQNWAEGRIGDCIGIFPIAFVEMNDLAKQIIDTTANKYYSLQYVLSTRNVPSIPAELVHSSSDSSSSNMNSSNSNSNTSSSSSTAPNSPVTATSVSASVNVQTPRELNGKRHSLTTFTSLNGTTDKNLLQSNRHSVEILTVPDSEPTTSQILNSSSSSASTGNARKESKRVHSSQTNESRNHESNLNSAYIARYAYKPQRSDELELKKGSIYIVSERCHDGWFRGCSRAHKSKTGVFPGNFVTSLLNSTNVDHMNHMKALIEPQQIQQQMPPELPPRNNPNLGNTNRKTLSQIHRKNEDKHFVRAVASQTATPTTSKDKKESSSTAMNIMKRLANIKISKSPPTQNPTKYLMDNPVFEDSAAGPSSATAMSSVSRRNIQLSHPIHVRSGSCPSQLLQNLSITESNSSSTTELPPPHLYGSQRIKGHKERPMLHGWRQMESSRLRENLNGRPIQHTQVINNSTDIPLTIAHRKTQSLDAGSSPMVNNTPKNKIYAINEKFKCIVSYPPNSEFELELNVGDVIFVHKKRDNGWYKGTHSITGKVGLFPASFVEPVV